MTQRDIKVQVQLKRRSFELTVDCALPGSGVTAIYGESGSGKTTLLRCIAGLEKSNVAQIKFGEETWQNDQYVVPVFKRPIGYVFQEASLFDHLTAQQNIEFAIKRANKTETFFDKDKVIDVLGIAQVLNQFPSELSGGERQRVAIARALLIQPKLLLMDEPLSSLDSTRKKEILPYLEKLKQEFNLPILYVTHSPEEVARLADYLLILENGKVCAHGELSVILSRMDNPLQIVEEAGVVLEGEVLDKDRQWHLAKVRTQCGDFWLRDSGHEAGRAVRIRVLARDVSLSLQKSDQSSIVNIFSATVIDLAVDEHPGLTLVQLELGEGLLLARVSTRSAYELQLTKGMQLWAQIKSVAIVQ